MSTSTSCCSRSIFSWILKGPPQTRQIPETMGKSRGKHMETYGQKPLAYGGLVIVGTSSVNMGGTMVVLYGMRFITGYYDVS